MFARDCLTIKRYSVLFLYPPDNIYFFSEFYAVLVFLQ